MTDKIDVLAELGRLKANYRLKIEQYNELSEEHEKTVVWK